MDLTHEIFQKARRISRAIQEHLELVGKDGLRSNHLYPVLAKKKLIEQDRHNGLHFRKFLRKLHNNDLLHLIPQCKIEHTTNEFINWCFYRVSNEPISFNKESNQKLIEPKLDELSIDKLINLAKPHVDNLPKRKTDKLNYTQKEIRKLYPRAFEYWSDREIEIARRAYRKFGRIDKIAQLLERQPSAVTTKLKCLSIIENNN